MVWSLPCFSRGTEVVPRNSKTFSRREVRNDVTLIVRYSAVEENISEATEHVGESDG